MMKPESLRQRAKALLAMDNSFLDTVSCYSISLKTKYHKLCVVFLIRLLWVGSENYTPKYL